MGLSWTTVVTSKDTDNHTRYFYKPWAWNQRAWREKGDKLWEVHRGSSFVGLLVCWRKKTWLTSSFLSAAPGSQMSDLFYLELWREQTNSVCVCERAHVWDWETLRNPVRIRKHSFYMQTKSGVSLLSKQVQRLISDLMNVTLKSHVMFCRMRLLNEGNREDFCPRLCSLKQMPPVQQSSAEKI